MKIRLWEDIFPVGDKGVLLFTDDAAETLFLGFSMQDARGKIHRVSRVEPQEDWFALFVEKGDRAYFERLFRDVRVDARTMEVLANAGDGTVSGQA